MAIINSPCYQGDITDDMLFLAYSPDRWSGGIPIFENSNNKTYYIGSFKNLHSELDKLNLELYIFAIFKSREDYERGSLFLMKFPIFNSQLMKCLGPRLVDLIDIIKPYVHLKITVKDEVRQFGCRKFRECVNIMNAYQQNFQPPNELSKQDFKIMLALSLGGSDDILMRYRDEIKLEWLEELELSTCVWKALVEKNIVGDVDGILVNMYDSDDCWIKVMNPKVTPCVTPPYVFRIIPDKLAFMKNPLNEKVMQPVSRE